MVLRGTAFDEAQNRVHAKSSHRASCRRLHYFWRHDARDARTHSAYSFTRYRTRTGAFRFCYFGTVIGPRNVGAVLRALQDWISDETRRGLACPLRGFRRCFARRVRGAMSRSTGLRSAWPARTPSADARFAIERRLAVLSKRGGLTGRDVFLCASDVSDARPNAKPRLERPKGRCSVEFQRRPRARPLVSSFQASRARTGARTTACSAA